MDLHFMRGKRGNESGWIDRYDIQIKRSMILFQWNP